MKTILDLSQELTIAVKKQGLTYQALQDATSLNKLTIAGAIKGVKDSKISTIFALAKELGLELVLVPSVVASTLERPSESVVPVKNWIDAQMEKFETQVQGKQLQNKQAQAKQG